jgi:hypothetical protein
LKTNRKNIIPKTEVCSTNEDLVIYSETFKLLRVYVLENSDQNSIYRLLKFVNDKNKARELLSIFI